MRYPLIPKLDGLCKGGPAAAALVLIRGGKERLAGHDIHIDALFKLVPELACEGALRAALLRDVVLAPPSACPGWTPPRKLAEA